MKSSPIRLGGQLAAVAALPFFPTQALADVQSFRAVDLRALTGLAGFSWKQDAIHLADVARFYDDGLTHPQGALTGLAGFSWKQDAIHLADVARFYDDGLTHPMQVIDTPDYQKYDYWNGITPNPIPEIEIANQIWPILVE